MLKTSVTPEIKTHITSLRRYALVLTRNLDAAEDLVQETLLKGIAKADTLRPGSDLRPWLFRIMHNTHVSAQRSAAPARATPPSPTCPSRSHPNISTAS